MEKEDKKNINNKKNKSKFNEEFAEDVTLYGENVSSLFKWLPLKEQKKITKHLENTTKDG